MTKLEDLPNKEYFTPKEAAYHVDVDQTTVCRWCKSGFWTGRKPRGRWAVDRQSIVKYLSFFAGLLLFASMQTEFMPNTRKFHTKTIQAPAAAILPAFIVRRKHR